MWCVSWLDFVRDNYTRVSLVFLYIHLLCNSSTSSPTVACSSNGQGDRLSGVEMSGNFTAVSNCLESGQPDLKVLLWTCCRMSMFVDVLIRHAATLVDGGGSCLPCALYCAPPPSSSATVRRMMLCILWVSYCFQLLWGTPNIHLKLLGYVAYVNTAQFNRPSGKVIIRYTY